MQHNIPDVPVVLGDQHPRREIVPAPVNMLRLGSIGVCLLAPFNLLKVNLECLLQLRSVRQIVLERSEGLGTVLAEGL